jgi:TonB family protein
MKKLLNKLALFACAAALPASPLSAATLRQPIGKWVVDYNDTMCTAARTYGSQEAPVTLAFRPSPNGTVVRLMVVRRGRVGEAYHFAVRTSVSGEKKMSGLRFPSANKKSEIIWINFARPDLEGLRTAGEIAITSKKGIDERFALPSIGAVLDELDRCNANLREHWNVGETATAKVTQVANPVRELPKLFSPDDYPAQAIDESASGTVRMMMMIDETGTLKDCMVEETSGIATLDAMGCGLLLKRAKFKPALDVAGKPIRSVLTTGITWRISY